MQTPSRPTAKIIYFEPRDLLTWEEVRESGLEPIPPEVTDADMDDYYEELAPVIDLQGVRARRILRHR